MARRRPAEQPAGPAVEEVPPLELRRCPWTRWDSEDRSTARFAEWLAERQTWRQSHAVPLPGLCARDRMVLHQLDGLAPDVVRAEESAPRAGGEWRA